MKSALIAAALLFATAAHAEQTFKVEAQFTVDGKSVGTYVAEIPADVTGQFSNTQYRLYTSSIRNQAGKAPLRIKEPLITGLQLTATPKSKSDGKILLAYDLDFQHLVSMKQKSDEGSALKVDLPTMHQVKTAGRLSMVSGTQTELSGSNKDGSWELTLKATKL